mmetsp:Transcript_68083/g.221688  ORF Transcript_68083/g.221688 Transcript_68083/m.221688 type:complete len:198 (-) Transcript_68083:703-1296(-)
MASHQSEAPRSINDLLSMAERPPEHRARQLHETLKVGPRARSPAPRGDAFRFLQRAQHQPSVIEYEHLRGVAGLMDQEYHELTRDIFNQHRGTMLEVARGVFEFSEDLTNLFGKNLELAEVRGDLRHIQGVETSLDEFFTDRLTLRLLISHVHSLNKLKLTAGAEDPDMVGVVNVNTRPIAILSRAYVSALGVPKSS